MVQPQKFIVNVYRRIVRTPLPNHPKVNQAQHQNKLQREMKLLHKNWQHHRQLQKKIKQQVNQNVKRVEVGSVWTVLIMLQLFDQWRWSHALLLFSHPWLPECVVWIENLKAPNSDGQVKNCWVKREWNCFNHFQWHEFFCRCGLSAGDGRKEQNIVEHHDCGKKDMAVHPLSFSLETCVLVLDLLFPGLYVIWAYFDFVAKISAINQDYNQDRD